MRKWLGLVVTINLIGVAAGTVGAQSAFPDPAKWDSTGAIRIFEQNAGALLSGFYRRGGFDNGASTFAVNNDMFRDHPVHAIPW